ncbi:MAG: succinate dehydrogenase/fumarate reductase iron-sulfur subunit [Anaerolineae bacterium]
MGRGDAERTATVRVQRFNPDEDREPRMQDFTIVLRPGTTVLDALHRIKTEQDGTLTYRRSCRHAICGSCAMNVNGANRLVCNMPLREQLDRSGTVTIKPLPYLPIIKDLVVDRSTFWEQYLRVRPWLVPPDDVPEKEFRLSPAEVEALHHAETCIMCGACYSSCQVIGMNKSYVGPHAALKAFLRVLDPRDTIPGDRLEDLSGGDGVYRCHTIFNCIDACPKNLNPTQAIETLRKLAAKREAYDRDRRVRQASLSEPIASE